MSLDELELELELLELELVIVLGFEVVLDVVLLVAELLEVVEELFPGN